MLYRRVVEAFPDAWIEDPKLTPETEEVLAGDRDRITWDAPIHTVDDVEALPFPPKMVNVKPSRARRRCDRCSRRTTTASSAASGCTAADSSSSAPGRGHIQYLASLFHPDTPNDVAPGGYNAARPGRRAAVEPAAGAGARAPAFAGAGRPRRPSAGSRSRAARV